MHSPEPCGPCLHLSVVSRAPPFGHGEVDPPQTHAPPPGTHVSSSAEPLLDSSPELLEVACVLPEDDVDDVAPLLLRGRAALGRRFH